MVSQHSSHRDPKTDKSRARSVWVAAPASPPWEQRGSNRCLTLDGIHKCTSGSNHRPKPRSILRRREGNSGRCSPAGWSSRKTTHRRCRLAPRRTTRNSLSSRGRGKWAEAQGRHSRTHPWSRHPSRHPLLPHFRIWIPRLRRRCPFLTGRSRPHSIPRPTKKLQQAKCASSEPPQVLTTPQQSRGRAVAPIRGSPYSRGQVLRSRIRLRHRHGRTLFSSSERTFPASGCPG
jgi:hypothetical protein